MHGHDTPQRPALARQRRYVHPLRIAALLIAGLCAAGHAGAQVTTRAFTLTAPAQAVETRIEVSTGGSTRIVFSSLRSTVPLARVELIDPAGRIAQHERGDALKLLPAEEAAHPERGDVYRLDEVRQATAGTWRLRFVPVAGRRGRIVGAYSLRPRFELLLPMSPVPMRAHERAVIEVMATDNGAPLSNVRAIRVWIEDAGGRRIVQGEARTGQRNERGILLSQQPEQLLALVTAPAPGRYRLKAAHDFGHGEIVSERELIVQ